MNKTINETLFELIKKQFVKLMQKDVDFYKDYNVILSNEQQFVDSSKRENQPNTIYIVVKFLPSSMLFGQFLQNITMEAVSEQNGIDVCRTLINEYAINYNLQDKSSIINNEKYTIKQTYTSPMIASNFNEIFYGYRSLFSISGTFQVGKNANYDLFYLDSITNTEYKIEAITIAKAFSTTPNTQPYFNSNNRVRSIAKYGALSFSITLPLTNNPLIAKVLEIESGQNKDIDTKFTFSIRYEHNPNLNIENRQFILINVADQKNIGEIPTATLTFIE